MEGGRLQLQSFDFVPELFLESMRGVEVLCGGSSLTTCSVIFLPEFTYVAVVEVLRGG